MTQTERILIVEDLPTDADLCEREINKALGPCEFRRVETREEFLAALEGVRPTLIVSDFKLPSFDGLTALSLAKERAPDVPFIILTGSMNEDTAVECMKAGAWDYVIKEHIKRLGSAARAVLEQKRLRQERRAAETALLRSETRFRTLYESSCDALMLLDENGFFDCNEATVRIFGCRDREEFCAKHPSDVSPARQPCGTDSMTLAGRRIAEAMETGTNSFEWIHKRLDTGEDFPAEVLLNRIVLDGRPVLQATVRNISERKLAESRERLAREVLDLLNRPEGASTAMRDILKLVKVSIEFDAVGIRLREGDDFPYIETNGFSDDFVTAERYLCSHDKDGNLILDAAGRPALECMCGVVLSSRTDPSKPFFTAYGSFWTNSTTKLLASTTEEERQGITRNRCNSAGYESLALIPLRSGSEIIGLVQINDRRQDRFTGETIRFFEGLSSSIGVALLRQRAEEQRRDAMEKLRTTFDGIVQTIMRAVETRDPYTAGHQRRVADLACSISEEMGMRGESIDAIRLAANIHDIGKIAVPSEILSKPGRLNPSEFSLIKMHSRTGFEMLEPVEFPWPLPTIVLQHHERLDGSGYPDGLTGAAILPEARIIAVADVVEAMATHRPYRPALGVDAALEEITKQRGVKLDEAAVDACVRLFREKGYALPE
jgi:PAS domain S-box-containing protein